MFAQGDEVTEPSFSVIDKGDTGSVYGGQQYLGIPAPTSFVNTYDIIADDAGQYYAKKDDMVIPIDMSMGLTPRDAFKNMEKIKGIDGLVNSAITVASLIAFKRPMGKMGNVAKGIGSKFVKPKDFIAGPQGMKVASTLDQITPFGKGVLGITGGVGALTGSQNLIDSAEQSIRNETQEALDNLTEPNVVNAKVVASEKFNTEVPSKSDIDNKDEEKNKELTTEELFEEYKKQTNPKQFQTKFLDSPNFLRFLKNVSTGLATAPDMATGLATGAAMAAEERFEEEKLSGQASKMDEFLAKERIKNTAPDKIAKQTNDLAQAVSDYEQGQITLQMFESAKSIMKEGEITGLGAIAGTLFNQAMSFLPGGSTRPLTPRQRAIVVLEQIANGNIKTITGESGRTISNVDRQIAEKLVGSLKNPATSETEVLDRIDTQINSVKQRTSKALNNYKATSLYFTQNGLNVPLTPKDFSKDVFSTIAKNNTENRVRLPMSN